MSVPVYRETGSFSRDGLVGPKYFQKRAALFLVHLIHRTLARVFVRPPAQEARSMTKAFAAHMIELHLGDQFRFEGLPLGRAVC